jgi:hypothetical protein
MFREVKVVKRSITVNLRLAGHVGDWKDVSAFESVRSSSTDGILTGLMSGVRDREIFLPV